MNKDKMYRVKMGAIIKIVPSGSLKWYIQANWKVLGEYNDKTNSKKNARK